MYMINNMINYLHFYIDLQEKVADIKYIHLELGVIRYNNVLYNLRYEGISGICGSIIL
jgi:hypothetical protein